MRNVMSSGDRGGTETTSLRITQEIPAGTAGDAIGMNHLDLIHLKPLSSSRHASMSTGDRRLTIPWPIHWRAFCLQYSYSFHVLVVFFEYTSLICFMLPRLIRGMPI